MSPEDLLAEINRDLPPGVDWKAGARRYLAEYFRKYGREPIERYSLNKPFGLVGTGGNADAQRKEIVEHLYNFTNAIEVLRPRAGTRVLDVACGGGWVSHYLTKMGCVAYGFDISEDFIDMARKRLLSDPTLDFPAEAACERFFCLDIESTPIPAPLRGTFDIVWLESCLHHLFDPVAALSHLADALAPDGVILVIEGSNRKGRIDEEFMKVMLETETLERPYFRDHLVMALSLAGLPHVEFVGKVNGWFRPDDLHQGALHQRFSLAQEGMNLGICARNASALAKHFRASGERTPVVFGLGFFANESGLRWCGPIGEIAVRGQHRFTLDIRSSLPMRNARPQTIRVYGRQGLIETIVLDEGKLAAMVPIDPSMAGEAITLCSSDAFSPAWDGKDDGRLLSFYVKTEY